ncbi:hypothetical protein E1180_06430 [Roseibium denhamense]|uniref:Uncharacterized protein n=1 Tax=Roseibium denhamense TaxID=76305 RepID=A0ABY1NYY8_9HYPH|nr:hypothetical protein [Roseibium denhamense]MTI05149.1 hypothetical protein [Roseibium denhamense]SMP22408.1 hypothetical protein SAMN06265374_2167 [Roseibium denhamense]
MKPSATNTALLTALGIFLPLLIGSTLANAQSGRPDTRTMTCSAVQSFIQQQGGVVMRTGQNTFDRYVANKNFCYRQQFIYWESVASKDNAKCRVRRCSDTSPWLFYD